MNFTKMNGIMSEKNRYADKMSVFKSIKNDFSYHVFRLSMVFIGLSKI